MFSRRHTVRKNGKAHKDWALVRSVLQGSKVRQETVAYLGDLDAKGRASASTLARHFLGGKVDGQRELFEDRSPAEPGGVRVRCLHRRQRRGPQAPRVDEDRGRDPRLER